jgi:hypothetical protein
MGIGASIFLIAVGAIIAFALEVRVGWLDLDVVGWVLMLAGLAGLLFTFGLLNRRRRVVASTTQRSAYDAPPAAPAVDAPAQRTVVDTPGQRPVGDPAPRREVVEHEEIEHPL